MIKIIIESENEKIQISINTDNFSDKRIVIGDNEYIISKITKSNKEKMLNDLFADDNFWN